MARLSEDEKRARREARQEKCHHEWTHAFETVNNRLASGTWCRKCLITDFEYQRQNERAPHDPA